MRFYKLPDEMSMMKDYLYEGAACNWGITPSGCGTTYLDGSYSESLAEIGPCTIVSVGKTTNDIILQANPNYCGGPFATKNTPSYQTIYLKVNDVPSWKLPLQSPVTSWCFPSSRTLTKREPPS